MANRSSSRSSAVFGRAPSYSNNCSLTFDKRIGCDAYPAGNAARPHAPTTIATRAIGYDANGNMVSDGVRTLGWDGANRLSIVTQAGATTTFLYGPSGARARKSNAFATTLYLDANVEIDRSTPGQDV
ncbi:hypothetical protein [Ensifer sp. SSB1]|jgi:hypothetical protein|uniref:hypothetical protein n=1 Tax=Ensifer sp. SSB1 TaxID=2795385 RepID=UPI001A4307D8|nr:hypothetical protein [Ensifer sp. SSB1]MBK5571812.1 hypothetical protein [Ensifer sp. SSB1]